MAGAEPGIFDRGGANTFKKKKQTAVPECPHIVIRPVSAKEVEGALGVPPLNLPRTWDHCMNAPGSG